MIDGYGKPLYILPFDHRESYVSDLFGWRDALNPEQTAEVAASKQVIYEGFKAAVADGGRLADGAGILVDEQFGAAILRDARDRGYLTCVSTERSGQEEFEFEYGEAFALHIESMNPTFAKVLVRYNPEGDQAMNTRQAERLRRLSDYLEKARRLFLFELLVPPTKAQLQRLGNAQAIYDRDVRPGLMVDAIAALQRAGVEPDVWKIEGLDSAEDCQRIVQIARRDGRTGVSCVVLGRGSDEMAVSRWLTVAGGVPGFIGFAVGRTTWLDAMMKWRAHTMSRLDATAQIARRFHEWAAVFEHVPAR
jgi:myo-inositol catabolism protein IolC